MKICLISDTHCQHPKLPDADLLIHCGDLTGSGTKNAFAQEVGWLRSVKPNYPLGVYYVPGNHDKSLDSAAEKKAWEYWAKDPYHRYPPPKKKESDREKIEELFRLADINILIDRGVTVEGIKIWGSPMTPRFMDWAFMDTEDNLHKHWSMIDPDTNILITHGPAQHILDWCPNGHVGSSSLRWHLDNHLPKLKMHAFGHIHESAGWGQAVRSESGLDSYLVVNAAVLDGHYNGYNDIYVVDTDTWSVCETFKDTAI